MEDPEVSFSRASSPRFVVCVLLLMLVMFSVSVNNVIFVVKIVVHFIYRRTL
jgi:hypothetical protein